MSKLSELLISAGYSPRVAKAFAWLILNSDWAITTREMERGADLRQPEAHYAIKVMSEKGWIQKVEQTSSPKQGRPFMLYKMAMTREQAYQEILKSITGKQDAYRATAEEIRAEILGGKNAPTPT